MLNTKNAHFPCEILIFWLLRDAKNAARAWGHPPRQDPRQDPMLGPKKEKIPYLNGKTQPRGTRIQFLKEPQGPHSASTVWGMQTDTFIYIYIY